MRRSCTVALIFAGLLITVSNTFAASASIENEMTGLVDLNGPGYGAEDYNSEFQYPEAPNGQVVGFYARYKGSDGVWRYGSIKNATALELEGFGWLKIFRSRGRYWGAYDSVKIIEWISNEMMILFPWGERLQIGDISPQKGGKTGHESHQNGLDFDIAYLNVDRHEQDVTFDLRGSSTGFELSFVKGGKLTDKFDIERNWNLFRLLVSTGRVKRAFVDKAIKNAMCVYARDNGIYEENIETLRRLRTLANHDDHVHVRLTCPINSPKCISQVDPVQGSSCDPKTCICN